MTAALPPSKRRPHPRPKHPLPGYGPRSLLVPPLLIDLAELSFIREGDGDGESHFVAPPKPNPAVVSRLVPAPPNGELTAEEITANLRAADRERKRRLREAVQMHPTATQRYYAPNPDPRTYWYAEMQKPAPPPHTVSATGIHPSWLPYLRDRR